MRIIDTIAHPHLRISVFEINDKYLVKVEGGPMEQVFKWDKSRVPSLEMVKQLTDEIFLNEAYERFNTMFESMQNTLNRN